MAKWIECKEGYVNVEKIEALTLECEAGKWYVLASGIWKLAEFTSRRKAKKFIKDFIEENYVKTGKIT